MLDTELTSFQHTTSHYVSELLHIEHRLLSSGLVVNRTPGLSCKAVPTTASVQAPGPVLSRVSIFVYSLNFRLYERAM